MAVAGLDQIEVAQRELDRSVRTLVAESLEIGAEWFDTNGEESGQTADPILLEVSMNRIMSGRQRSSSPAEIEAGYRERAAADMDAARAAAVEQGEDFARNTITEIAAVVRNFEVPSLDIAARAGLCAATDPHHRDAMIGIVTISPQAAADAFGTIAARLRGNYRVQIVTFAVGHVRRCRRTCARIVGAPVIAASVRGSGKGVIQGSVCRPVADSPGAVFSPPSHNVYVVRVG